MKEQENSPDEDLDEMEASNLSHRVQSDDYKDTQQHEKRHRNNKIGPVRNKNEISEINNILEGINNKLDEAEVRISILEDKVEKKHPGRAV